MRQQWHVRYTDGTNSTDGTDCTLIQVASMLTHRGGAGCGTLHNFLFVAGGDDRSSRLNSVEMFDPHMAKVRVLTPYLIIQLLCVLYNGWLLLSLYSVNGSLIVDTLGRDAGYTKYASHKQPLYSTPHYFLVQEWWAECV